MNHVEPSTLTPESAPRPLVRRIGIGLGVLALAAVGYGCWGRKGKEAEVKGPRAVPVDVVTAKKGDLEVHLAGLGTVTPLSVVTVKSRVDGHLQRVLVQEGQQVQEGQLLAEIDPRPFQVQLMQAQGTYAKDEATLKNAQADLRRFQSLVAQGILSRQQVDTQETLVNQLSAALQADRAAVENAKLNLTYSRITAPLSGRIGLRQVDPGNLVRATDATGLFVITPVAPINVVFAIPGDQIQPVLAQFRAGKLAVEAFDRDMRQKLALGSLAAIDNQVDPATGTVKLKALFDNKDGQLFPNQFVNARLRMESLKNAVLVPTVAVQRGAQGAFVYVVKADATADLRPVTVQGTEGDVTALSKGVEPGESVVIEGLEKLRPGAKVALPKAEAKAGGPSKGRK